MASRRQIADRLASIAAAKPVSAPPEVKPADARQASRRDVYRLARLVVAGGVSVNCLILDLSADGARIELDGAAGIPDYVILKTAATGETRRARVCWRSAKSAGLSFAL